MRYTFPKDGDVRVRRRFAWRPVVGLSPSGSMELRWLEWVVVKEVYNELPLVPLLSGWETVAFVDDK